MTILDSCATQQPSISSPPPQNHFICLFLILFSLETYDKIAVFSFSTQMKSRSTFKSTRNPRWCSVRLEKLSLIPNSAAAVSLIPADVLQSCLFQLARVFRSGARQSGGEQREVLSNKDGNVSLNLTTSFCRRLHKVFERECPVRR